MTWNYPLIKHSEAADRVDGEQSEDWFAIHEAYYDSGGKPNSMTAEPVTVTGDSASRPSRSTG